MELLYPQHTYTKLLLLNGKFQHHADFRKLSHRAAQRQSTFALTPSVATTLTVCAAREPKRAEYWVAEETFLSFFQADNAGSALSSSCEPRARARRRALTEQQPLPALRHAAASSTRTFDQDWELFQNKSQLLCALYSGIIIPCKFRQVKCQNWHPLDTRPNFDGFWPLASGQQVHSCSGLVQTWTQQKSVCRENFNSSKKIRQMAESRTTLWNLTRKIAPEVDLQGNPFTSRKWIFFWFWNRMQNKSSVSECNLLVIVQKLCICLFVCLFVCFVYIFLHYLNLRCSAEI